MISTKCKVCGTNHKGESFVDACPYCDWIECLTEIGEEDEITSANHMTLNQARENFSKGLNIWGNPLPKIRPIIE